MSASGDAGQSNETASATIAIQSGALPLTAAGTPAAQLAAGEYSIGTVVPGVYRVAVDGLQGPMAQAEQARIGDAIGALNATFGSFGVTLVEVGPGSPDATIQLTVGDMTSLGGVAQGILGAMEPGGNITLVSGWNWYTGSNPAQIGPDQYDFETIVMHELGHTSGLGESDDPASVMYYQLAPGEVRTSLTASDLSLLRGDDGVGQADALALNLGASSTQQTPTPIGPQAGVGVGWSSPLAGRSESAETQGAPAAALPDDSDAVSAAAAPSAPASDDAGGSLSPASEAGLVLPAPDVANHSAITPAVATAMGSTFEAVVGSVASDGAVPTLGQAVSPGPVGTMSIPTTGATATPATTGLLVQSPAWPAIQPAMDSPIASRHPDAVAALDRANTEALLPARHRTDVTIDSVLDDLATDPALAPWPRGGWDGAVTIHVLAPDSGPVADAPTAPVVQPDSTRSPESFAERMTVLGLAAGLWCRAGLLGARRRTGSPSLARRPLESWSD